MTRRLLVFAAITAAVVAVVLRAHDEPASHPCHSINYPCHE